MKTETLKETKKALRTAEANLKQEECYTMYLLLSLTLKGQESIEGFLRSREPEEVQHFLRIWDIYKFHTISEIVPDPDFGKIIKELTTY